MSNVKTPKYRWVFFEKKVDTISILKHCIGSIYWNFPSLFFSSHQQYKIYNLNKPILLLSNFLVRLHASIPEDGVHYLVFDL